MITIRTPSPVSSLAYGPSGHVFAGSEDGTLRVYHEPSSKVLKAIRGLGCEVSSIVPFEMPGAELGSVWLALGRKISSFQLDSQKMVLTLLDAVVTVTLDVDEDDVLNELVLSSNRKYLAFSLDSGIVGVVDLRTNQVSKMKTKHDNICGTVKFIPDRPSELVSGGFDQALLHFDFLQCKLLSRRDLATLPVEDGMSLSPPFVMSTSLSSTGILAAGTADGRLWLGFGGERSGGNKKRSRKWEGLREADELTVQVAEGPVVAVAFVDPSTLIICTLLGKAKLCRISLNPDNRTFEVEQQWSMDTKAVVKVNAMILNDKWIHIGGLGKEGEGIIEVWDRYMTQS